MSTIESKILSGFPEMGDRPWSACFARITLQFFLCDSFKSGRPTGPLNFVFNGRNRIQAEVELNQKLQRRRWSPRLRIGFDMVPQSRKKLAYLQATQERKLIEEHGDIN
jgi:hypothetical protein